MDRASTEPVGLAVRLAETRAGTDDRTLAVEDAVVAGLLANVTHQTCHPCNFHPSESLREEEGLVSEKESLWISSAVEKQRASHFRYKEPSTSEQGLQEGRTLKGVPLMVQSQLANRLGRLDPETEVAPVARRQSTRTGAGVGKLSSAFSWCIPKRISSRGLQHDHLPS